MRPHDVREAERLLTKGVQRLGIAADEMASLKKSDPRKQALAWLVKSGSVVGDGWIAARLEMGHRSNISRAVSAFRSLASREHRELRQLLHTCTE